MSTTTHNPDVLNCLANLSNDEVFTPPSVANDVLDLLPASLWRDPRTTFLDPVCKSGVFLREIAKRLDLGLTDQIRDKQERLNHIFTKQLYGIAITELTGLMSRRTVYGTKTANGKHSFCTRFKDEDGHIRYVRLEHPWSKGRCVYCPASETNYSRADVLESHAYEFIHTESLKEIFGMRFDVIVGNPPYQLSDGGGNGRAASPIYNLFVEQARRLKPRFLSMVIPSRWFGGGRGLSRFRASMIEDRSLRKIVDFEDAGEVFPNVDIAGGVCYFLWDRDDQGDCEIVNVHRGERIASVRPLDEFDTLIRHSAAVPIVRKIRAAKEKPLSETVSSLRPFGLRTYARPKDKGSLTLRWHNGSGPYPRTEITEGKQMIGRWKTIISKVSYDHAGLPDRNGMRKVLSVLDVLPPGTICTETYLVVDHFDSEVEAQRMVAYLTTRLVRFLIAQLSFSQDIFKSKFALVPHVPMDQDWDDAKLAKRYGLAADEVAFIESKIRPWDKV